MTLSFKPKTTEPCDRRFLGKASGGAAAFSTVEMMIVGAVLISLAALGGVAYQSYLASVKETLSKQQSSRITEQVDTAVGFVVRGANAGLRSQDTGYPITEMSTCGEFMDALKKQLQDLKNPYDGSPAITFYSGYSWQQKRGKIRITCFKMRGTHASNGRECRMKDAGIRVTHFVYSCGGRCGDPLCQYPSGDCGGGTPGSWIDGGQVEKMYGNIEEKYLKHDNGTIKEAPWGGPWPDFGYADSICPGYTMSVVPKEADY